MKEFVEFKGVDEELVAVRTGYTTAVTWTKAGAVIYVDYGRYGETFDVAEPYEQVIAKLEASEHIEVPVQAEHFTRDEYAELKSVVEFMRDEGHIPVNPVVDFNQLYDKLEKILKGEE